jgi:hypothetical protein
LGVLKSQNPSSKIEYPDKTAGTELGHVARRLASKLTPQQRAEHFRKGMAKIYGASKEATGVRH